MMNHCLAGLGKKPYSQNTGACALQMNTASLRIGSELEGVTNRLQKAAKGFIDVSWHLPGIYPIIEEMGFEHSKHFSLREFRMLCDAGLYVREAPFSKN